MPEHDPPPTPGSASGVLEPTLPLPMPRAENPAGRRTAPKRPSGRPRRTLAPELDLFGTALEDEEAERISVVVPEEAVEPAKPAKAPGRKRRSPEPAPSDAEPLPDAVEPLQPVAEAPVPEPVRTALQPDEILLQQVDPRSFRPNERPDAWLYWLTDRNGAQNALRDGLPIAPGETVLVSDRPAVLPQLAALAEDPDFSPAAIAVLRLRRVAVEAFLRPGPGPASFLLAAEAG